MYAVLRISQCLLQAHLRDESPPASSTPLALLDAALSEAQPKDRGKARVLEINAPARQAGVLPGMTATQAQARCATIHFFQRSAPKERSLQEDLLHCASRFSPDYEDTDPGICTLDLSSHRSLPGGEEALGQELQQSLQNDCRVPGTVGLAGNPELALLAAKLGSPILVLHNDPQQIREALDKHPLEILEPSPGLLEHLRLWGLRQVRDLTRLPREEIHRRLGAEASWLWERGCGQGERLLKLIRPPAVYHQACEFEHAIEQLEPLLFRIHRFLETIAARLEAHYLVARELRITLHFDNQPSFERTFHIPEPSRQVELLFRMLHTALEDFTSEAPIIGLALEAQPTREKKHQWQLFESSLKDPNRFAETLARLEGLLGTHRVGVPELLATHRPDAFKLNPFEEKHPNHKDPTPTGETPSSERATLGLPLKRFRPPRPVEVQMEANPRTGISEPMSFRTASAHEPIRSRSGPWNYSSDWWDRAYWRRQEWDVETARNVLYRLVLEQDHWFLEGIYG
ncbi:MAG: DNA polymerase Y family protein [Verrucomicrobiota bacterium]